VFFPAYNTLEEAGLTEAHVDLKAFSDDIHNWYTGKSNKPILRAIEKLNASELEFLVQTVHMPGIVDDAEIELIAQFLASINKYMRYRINPFASVFAYEKVTRRPTEEEMERTYEIALSYLPNAIISRSCYREYPTPPPQKTWITVYPDLRVERRGMKDQAEDRLSWLSRTRPEEKGSKLLKVKFPRALHAFTKMRETELVFYGSITIRMVIDRLVEEYGEEFREKIMDGSEIKRSFNVYLNGMNIKNLGGFKTQIQQLPFYKSI
jgi:hypothetical protein